MANNKWDSVEEYGDSNYRKIEPGCYVVGITRGEDDPSKKYNEFLFDIAEGDYSGYYNDDFFKDKPYAHRFIRSYKENALGFYKNFFLSVERSNGGRFSFDGNEHNAAQFVGHLVGIVLQEEEYISNTGELKTRVNVAKIVSAEDIRSGKVKPLALKELEDKPKPLPTVEYISSQDDPFL